MMEKVVKSFDLTSQQDNPIPAANPKGRFAASPSMANSSSRRE